MIGLSTKFREDTLSTSANAPLPHLSWRQFDWSLCWHLAFLLRRVNFFSHTFCWVNVTLDIKHTFVSSIECSEKNSICAYVASLKNGILSCRCRKRPKQQSKIPIDCAGRSPSMLCDFDDFYGIKNINGHEPSLVL